MIPICVIRLIRRPYEKIEIANAENSAREIVHPDEVVDVIILEKKKYRTEKTCYGAIEFTPKDCGGRQVTATRYN